MSNSRVQVWLDPECARLIKDIALEKKISMRKASKYLVRNKNWVGFSKW